MPDAVFLAFSSCLSIYWNGMWLPSSTHVACKACNTVTNCIQVSVSTQHTCLARTVNTNSSTPAPSESVQLPSPHEGDYTNLCKACKWFILQSTTKGFFTTAGTRRGERGRETLTPAVISTFTTTYVLLCHCQQERRRKTCWNLCIFVIIKLRGSMFDP